MRIFDKNSLVSQVVIIYLLSNIFAVIIFTVYITEKDRQATVENLESSLQEIAKEKARTLSFVMGQVMRETESFADFSIDYIQREKNRALPAAYKIKQDGVLYRKPFAGVKKSEYSSVFLPSSVQLNSNMVEMINGTEKLDQIMSGIQSRNSSIQWNYIATEEGLLRVLPYSRIDMYDSNHLQKRDPFYTIANQKNNPERKAVWSRPYIDYLGTGWMITCSAPLYLNNRFIGVTCSDVRLDIMQKEFLADFRLGDEGITYLLDDKGNIIYHPTIETKEGEKGQTFLTNIVSDTDLSASYKEALQSVIKKKNGIISYTDGDSKPHMIAFAKVDWQPWIMAVEMNQSKYLQINNLDGGGWWKFSIIFIGVYLLIIYFLYRQYSMPFNKLAKWAESIADGQFEYHKPIRNYTEIAMLSDTLNFMSAKIKEFTSSLIKKNKEIQNVIDGIGGLLMILSPSMEIITINKKAIQALKRPKKEIQGKRCYEVLAGRDSKCIGCNVEDTLESKEVKFSRIILNENIYQNTYYPLFDIEGQDKIIVQSQKITKRVMMEKELSQNEKMSEIGQLTAAIAHELKNPLAVIKAASYLLSTYADKNHEVVSESIETIIHSTENAENVVFNLLDYSRPTNMTNGDITKIADQVILLTNRDRIRNNVEITTEFHPDPLLYNGNVEPLKHIFMNLVTNGIHAMAEGGSISICGRYASSGKKQLILTIEDSGPGIEEDVMRKIFEPFVTTDKTGLGTGLGLWVTKIMVENMQGTIEVESDEGMGTKFTISLPVIDDKRGVQNE